jgi:transcription elongation factor
MKSFIYVTLLLITLSFCDDCSSKVEDECTGTCELTAGTAATCVKKTDCGSPSGSGAERTCAADTTNCKFDSDTDSCVSVAATCAVNDAGTACASADGCVFTAATQGTCAEADSDPDSDSDSDSDTTKSSAFGLKTSFLLIFLYFFL